METIKNVSISELQSFRNHPFKVETNTELCELMRSIEKEGVLVPLLVRTNPYGDGFEVISGHRRKEAALWAGETEVPVSNCGLDIDDKAFQSCGITALNISGSETVMGDNAFSYCEDLTDVIIGVGNTEIGTYSFYDCTSLENVSIAADSEDDSLSLVIDDKAFQSCSVQNVVIGRGNVELGDNAFSYCENLVGVEIKGVLSDIGDYVFYECPTELVISYNGGSYNKESIEDVK